MGKVISIEEAQVDRAAARYYNKDRMEKLFEQTGVLEERNPVAKSSTSVLRASVCQRCGCRLDGKLESMQKGCQCRCHRDGAR